MITSLNPIYNISDINKQLTPKLTFWHFNYKSIKRQHYQASQRPHHLLHFFQLLAARDVQTTAQVLPELGLNPFLEEQPEFLPELPVLELAVVELEVDGCLIYHFLEPLRQVDLNVDQAHGAGHTPIAAREEGPELRPFFDNVPFGILQHVLLDGFELEFGVAGAQWGGLAPQECLEGVEPVEVVEEQEGTELFFGLGVDVLERTQFGDGSQVVAGALQKFEEVFPGGEGSLLFVDPLAVGHQSHGEQTRLVLDSLLVYGGHELREEGLAGRQFLLDQGNNGLGGVSFGMVDVQAILDDDLHEDRDSLEDFVHEGVEVSVDAVPFLFHAVLGGALVVEPLALEDADKDHAHGVDIDGDVVRVAVGDPAVHVGRGPHSTAQHIPLLPQLGAAAQVADLGDSPAPDEDVVGLEVAMHDAHLVGVGQSLGDVPAEDHAVVVVEGVFFEVGGEAATWAVLDDDVVLGVVNDVAVDEADDVGVDQLLEVVHFPYDLLEGLHCVLVEVLEGHFQPLLGPHPQHVPERPLPQHLAIAVSISELLTIQPCAVFIIPLQFSRVRYVHTYMPAKQIQQFLQLPPYLSRDFNPIKVEILSNSRKIVGDRKNSGGWGGGDDYKFDFKLFQMENETVQRCDNCLKEYPESKMGTHYGYCRRNIKRCGVCHQMYDINFQDEHEEEYHKQETCPHCQRSFPAAEYPRHESGCTDKPRYCEYCELNVPVSTYPLHLKECEARTKPCTKCNRPITNKEYLIHLVSCPGPQEEPQPARNYQQHIQEQRIKVTEHYKPSAYCNSRDKPKPAYEPQKLKEDKNYIAITHERPVIQGSKAYVPPPPCQEPRVEEKKEVRYPAREQPKREQPRRVQPRRYPGSVNPPPPTVSYRRDEVRGPNGGKIITSTTTMTTTNQPTSHLTYDVRRQVPASREVKGGGINTPVSSKDIFGPKGTSIKGSKSIERQTQPAKREERAPVREAYQNLTSLNGQGRGRAPQSQLRAVYEQQTPEPRGNVGLQPEDYGMESMDLGGEDHELQMAIMQSMRQKGTGQGARGNSSYTFENEWSDPTFVAEQQAIEEELRKNQQRRR